MPYESLKRATRERKYAIDELQDIIRSLNGARGTTHTTRDSVVSELEGKVRQVQRLKRKLDAISNEEREEVSRCISRFEHLQVLGRPERLGHLRWNEKRIDRILVDYMLRRGYMDAAQLLIQSSSDLRELTDVHLFADTQTVLAAFESKDCSAALRWCQVHATRLRKMKSPLEFQIRVQEYIELLRRHQHQAALDYAKTHLTPWAELFPGDFRKAVALIAFGPYTQCPRYASYWDESRWNQLGSLFRSELLRLHALPRASLLEVHMQAGLSALKTPQSVGVDYTRNADPLHSPLYRRLAEGLPFAKHVHSKLICGLSGDVMTENNPPLALPNGHVYSSNALKEMSSKSNGKVTCPATGDVFDMSEIRRVFIM